MTSEIRTNSLKSRAGMSTVTMTDSGPMFSGITTFVDNSGFTFGVGGGTSIFTPATNVLTFGTNNTEKIRIDASGHMHGVGVITATHFYGDGSNLTGISAGTALSGSTNNTVCTVTGANAIQGESNLTFDGTNLRLGTTTAAIGGGRGMMIANSSGARIKLCDSDQGVDSGSGFEMIAGNGGTGYIWNRENQAILIGTNGTERMRVTHEGSVGIGTNNSTYELEVHDGSGAAALRLKDGANNVICDLIASSAGGHLRTTYNHPLLFSTNQVERLRINTSGQLLVGNSASGFATKLIVGSGSGDNGITIYGGTSNNTYLHFADGNSGADRYRGYVNYSHSDNSMQFGINDVEKVRINSTGLMIGTSTQVRALTIKDPGQIHVESTATGNWVGMSIKGSSGTNNYNAYFGVLDSNGKFFVDNGSNGNDIEIESSASGQKPGRVLVGPSVPTSGDDSQVIIRNNESEGIYRCLRLNNQSNNNRITMSFEGGGTQTGDIRINGSTTNYNSYSDYRLKENVVPLTDPITRLKTLKPYRFNFIASPDITLDGFFAHEVSPAVAEAVGGEKDKVDKDGNVVPQALDMAKLVPLLTASLQEAITKIETLEQDNIALRARITNLEGE